MAGRYDDHERGYRDLSDRYDAYGTDREGDRWSGREDRSFGPPDGRRDRVFGERETGVAYNRPIRGEGYGGGGYGGGGQGSSQDWQDPDYGGVSPAMRRGDYDTGYRANPRPSFERQDYTRGGRFYGDDGRGRVYREAYGKGYDYAPSPRDYDEGRRFGSAEADQRWAREMRRPASGGTGGYDYERGYGDGGRGDYGGSDFEDRAREAGDFFRRAGRRVSNWFNDLGREDQHDYAADAGYDDYRSHRGLGPKGYKRSDERITEEVHQKLTDDHWVDASYIDIAVKDGEVTLSGTVDSREAKHRAERIVENLSGVNHVQNNLRLRTGNYFSRSGEGSGDGAQALRHEGDASIATSANARHKT